MRTHMGRQRARRVLATAEDQETGEIVSREFTVRGRAGMRNMVQEIRRFDYVALCFRDLGPAKTGGPARQRRPRLRRREARP